MKNIMKVRKNNMGLDVTAYKNIKIIEDDEPEYHFTSGWEQSNMNNIHDKEIQIDFDEEFDFRAGSYGGYNFFRNFLCETINNITAEELWNEKDAEVKQFPFYWLINFTDCEGYIGTSYCKILYKNFLDNKELFMSKTEDNLRFQQTYLDFLEAFKISQEEGLVNFH